MFGGVDSISENFNFSADEMLSVNLPTVNLPEPPENLEDLAENALEGIDAALSIDASLDILSSRNVLAEAALGNIADAESILKDDSEMIVCLNNETFYLVKDKSFIPSSNYIQGRVIPDNYPDVKIPDNEDLLIFNLYRVFISIEVNDNASLMVNMPRLVVVKKNNELYDIDLLDELVFEVEDTLELEYENLFDEDFKLEINKKRVDPSDIKFTSDGSVKIKYEVSQELADLSFEAFQLGNPCFEVSISSSNALYFQATKVIGNDLAINLDKRLDKLYNGGFLNDKKDGKDWSDLAIKFPIRWSKYAADKSQTLLELRDSFCDLSFSITGQFSAYLSGFKNILTIIKVIFCIIDVICALLNPVKLAFATIRLFACLYELLLLIPQIAVPVALLSLILHLLELLKCVIEKILYAIRAINEISSALEEAVLNKDVEAVMNLEKVLSEYILDLETDIQVLEPIIDILNIFLELLQVFFAFPCSPGEGSSDEFRECQLDSSLVSGIILSKVTGESGDGLNPENLLPVAQAYTTLSIDDMYGSVQCGNTPPGTENDGLDWMGDCNYSGDILREPKDYIDSSVANKNLTNDGFLDNTLINTKSFRTSNFDANDGESDFDSIDFEATYGVTFTKSTKNPSNLSEAFIKGPDPRMVTFEFNSKGLTNALGYVPLLGLIFRKNYRYKSNI